MLKKGFTRIELVIVVLLLGSLFFLLPEHHFPYSQVNPRLKASIGQLQPFADQIRSFYSANQRWPEKGDFDQQEKALQTHSDIKSVQYFGEGRMSIAFQFSLQSDDLLHLRQVHIDDRVVLSPHLIFRDNACVMI